MKANNKTKTLQTDSNADIIFKQGDYVHTYIVISTNGYPDGATLYLLDSNMNQLYSPYDINGNQVKTECTIVVGETDALQLPANYDGNKYTDFEEGTYNWKLKYNGNQTFAEQIIPITIKIQDFDLEKNLTSEIYPNENIQIQLKTWLNTNPSVNNFDMDRLTTNASYDSSTGIITYPNSDINDLSIGEHTQIVNQKYELNYKIKNPIIFNYGYGDTHPCTYSRTIPIIIPKGCTMNFLTPKTNTNFVINDITYKATDVINLNGEKQAYFLKRFPPGSYSLTGTTILNDGNTYSVSGSFNVPTIGCSIILSYDENNVIATYMYNNETPIPNASIQILKDNVAIDTLTTNSNGQCTVAIQIGSIYKAQAIDYDNSILLESNNLLIQ